MGQNRLGANLYLPHEPQSVSVAISQSVKRSHKMKGANKRSKRDQKILTKIHQIELEFLRLPIKDQSTEFKRLFPNATIETRPAGKKGKKWSGELWVDGRLILQKRGKTSGQAYRNILKELSGVIAQAKLAQKS